MVEKTVGQSGNSGYIYAPAKWVGKRVVLILLDPLNESEKKG